VSPDDIEPPVHRISSVEDRERLLAEALAHAEEQEAHYRLPMEPRRRQPRWKLAVAFLLFVVAGSLALNPPALLRGRRPAAVTLGERERGIRATLYLQAQQVEAFRIERGRLPTSLSEVSVRLPGMEYVRSNSRTYQLVVRRPDGSTVVYDSSVPGRGFARLGAPWGLKDRVP
jgi:hypothetical protein